MDTRKEQLLKLVVQNYISTAEPIGSKFLVSEGGLDWSEATVRNELRALEEEGFLTHPHTSAGRVPTEKGYRYFVDALDKENIKLSRKDQTALDKMWQEEEDSEVSLKNLAKGLAELSEEAVLLAFSPNKVYYTGLSNLFNKPEFTEMSLVADISSMFDHCEECLGEFFDRIDTEPKCFIGQEHNFGRLLSVVSFRFGENSLLALMGLQRMDYKRNWGLMNKIKALI